MNQDALAGLVQSDRLSEFISSSYMEDAQGQPHLFGPCFANLSRVY